MSICPPASIKRSSQERGHGRAEIGCQIGDKALKVIALYVCGQRSPDPNVQIPKGTKRTSKSCTARSIAFSSKGPPGTGKTHTIANLLGCLLAQGKTVLVTAHTTKALRVLRNKVEPSLSPLCLSVLDGGPESQAQLSHAAQAIAARLATSDAAALRREAALLRDRRSELITLAEARRHELRLARLSEIDEVVFDGVSLRPIEAAQRVRDR